MQHLLEVADKIPWVMAPALVIVSTIVLSVLFSLGRILQPASKAMIVAVMLAMSAWAIMMRAFWRNSNLLILPFSIGFNRLLFNFDLGPLRGGDKKASSSAKSKSACQYCSCIALGIYRHWSFWNCFIGGMRLRDDFFSLLHFHKIWAMWITKVSMKPKFKADSSSIQQTVKVAGSHFAIYRKCVPQHSSGSEQPK